MKSKKKQSRKFNGMSYREVQRANSGSRTKLNQENQKWLKNNGYKNVGWDNVIKLYQKIKELLDKDALENFSLEELFLEADRVGNKYLTNEEIEEFNQALSKEVAEISDAIDKRFPDTTVEVIDYSSKATAPKNRKQSSYKTIKK